MQYTLAAKQKLLSPPTQKVLKCLRFPRSPKWRETGFLATSIIQLLVNWPNCCYVQLAGACGFLHPCIIRASSNLRGEKLRHLSTKTRLGWVKRLHWRLLRLLHGPGLCCSAIAKHTQIATRYLWDSKFRTYSFYHCGCWLCSSRHQQRNNLLSKVAVVYVDTTVRI